MLSEAVYRTHMRAKHNETMPPPVFVAHGRSAPQYPSPLTSPPPQQSPSRTGTAYSTPSTTSPQQQRSLLTSPIGEVVDDTAEGSSHGPSEGSLSLSATRREVVPHSALPAALSMEGQPIQSTDSEAVPPSLPSEADHPNDSPAVSTTAINNSVTASPQQQTAPLNEFLDAAVSRHKELLESLVVDRLSTARELMVPMIVLVQEFQNTMRVLLKRDGFQPSLMGGVTEKEVSEKLLSRVVESSTCCVYRDKRVWLANPPEQASEVMEDEVM